MVDVEFAVVGAGIAGAATARSLAQSNREVVCFEQFSVGNERGSSHGAARIFRYSYPDPHYVRLAMEALPLWRELEEEAGEALLVPTGGLDAGGSLDDNAAGLTACGAAFELLNAGAAALRWPNVAVAAGERVLFQPDAGVTRADAAIRALVTSAVGHGATFREETAVLSLRDAGDFVEIATESERYTATTAVVTAGSWARSLLAGCGIDLPVVATRETVAYFWLQEEMSVPTLVDWDQPTFYALPSPGQGLKAGLHHGGPATDPNLVGEVDDAAVELISRRVRDRFPTADPSPHHAETCLYTNTEDEHFILERRGRIVVGSACSGHGFKFAPLTGRRLAALAAHG